MADDKRYIQLIRGDKVESFLSKHPKAFLLFTQIALRARRNDCSISGLKKNQAFIGDPRNCGLTQREYRTAKTKLLSMSLCCFKTTNRGTIATITNTDVYDINTEGVRQTKDKQETNKRQTKDKQETTNKNERKKESNNVINNYKSQLLIKVERENLKEELREYFDITKSFYDLFENNLKEAGATVSNLEKAKGTWIDDIRLIIEKDGYTLDDCRKVWKFLNENEFWKKNIMSTSKLRKQFDKLLLNINSEQNEAHKRSNSKEATTVEQLEEITRRKYQEFIDKKKR